MKLILIFLIACAPFAVHSQTSAVSRSDTVMFGVKLRPEAAKLRGDVEHFFGKPVLEKQVNDPESRFYAGAGFAANGSPQIVFYSGMADEASIVHELFHLKLIAEGFPFINFTLPSDFINVPTTRLLQVIQSHIDDTLQHYIFYPKMRRMGFDPDIDTRDELRKAIETGTYGGLEKETDKSILFWMITLNYFKANLEVEDTALLNRLTAWYISKGWGENVKISGYFISLVKGSKLVTPKDFVTLIKKTLELIHPPNAKFIFKGWKTERRTSYLLRSITLEMERVFK